MELREYWRVICKRIVLILSIPILAASVAGVYAHKPTMPTYVASSTILLAETGGGAAPDPATLSGVVQSQVFTTAVAQADPNLSVSPPTLSQIVQVGVAGNLVTFTVTSPSEKLSIDAANDFAETFISQGQMIGGMPSSKLLDSATPQTVVSSASQKKNTPIELAVLIGLMVSLGIAFLLEYLDMRIKTEREMVKFLKLSSLGSVEDYRRRVGRVQAK